MTEPVPKTVFDLLVVVLPILTLIVGALWGKRTAKVDNQRTLERDERNFRRDKEMEIFLNLIEDVLTVIDGCGKSLTASHMVDEDTKRASGKEIAVEVLPSSDFILNFCEDSQAAYVRAMELYGSVDARLCILQMDDCLQWLDQISKATINALMEGTKHGVGYDYQGPLGKCEELKSNVVKAIVERYEEMWDTTKGKDNG